MNWVLYFLFLAFVVLLIGLRYWRSLDNAADDLAKLKLIKKLSKKECRFNVAMVADLPEPAQRYFRFTIKPGTTLRSVVEIKMTGEIALGTKKTPNYKSMYANQILAPPFGLIWKLQSGIISGSDGILPKTSWTRFWLFNLLPIVRVKGSDHHRSAFGRVVAEAVFWAPASLLPGKYITWEALDKDKARVTITYSQYVQAVDVTVSDLGAPIKIVTQRWSNENSSKVFKEQPFGGTLSDFKNFDGFTLPTIVHGGNLIDTPEYFPFYKANVTSITYPENDTNLDMSR